MKTFLDTRSHLFSFGLQNHLVQHLTITMCMQTCSDEEWNRHPTKVWANLGWLELTVARPSVGPLVCPSGHPSTRPPAQCSADQQFFDKNK